MLRKKLTILKAPFPWISKKIHTTFQEGGNPLAMRHFVFGAQPITAESFLDESQVRVCFQNRNVNNFFYVNTCLFTLFSRPESLPWLKLLIALGTFAFKFLERSWNIVFEFARKTAKHCYKINTHRLYFCICSWQPSRLSTWSWMFQSDTY